MVIDCNDDFSISQYQAKFRTNTLTYQLEPFYWYQADTEGIKTEMFTNILLRTWNQILV